ncbi:MAG: protease inhibitor I42 family protein [Gammaproteobacteria bacterium]|nr:protease inhibitor I42 family protein [Gammaproteobacteria bacterium]
MINKILFTLLGLICCVAANANTILVTKKKPTFTITLRSNPTTGYSWFLKKCNYHLIKPVSQKFMADRAALKKGIMGAPGLSVWTFRAQPAAFAVPQVTRLKWVSMRPWEGLVKGQEQATYTVVMNNQ